MTLSYRGTSFCGWQKQKRASGEKSSILATLENCLNEITGEVPSVVGSGRTDAGVHAIGQVAHFILRQKSWDADILRKGINSKLSASLQIQVLSLIPVDLNFHAQRSALKKQYSYYFQQGPAPLPHLSPYSWWIRKGLDQKAMSHALQALVGEHDFLPFQARGAILKSTIRRIHHASVQFEPVYFPGASELEGFKFLRVKVIGSGFLKQMVRGIVGTLLQIGEGRRSPTAFKEILLSQDRSQVGPTAPARGLWLEEVIYNE